MPDLDVLYEGRATYLRSLLAGGIAGIIVDVSLYPIDTIKTRLQSAQGFAAAGGVSGIYKGIGSVVVGSAPGAALFFVTYEGLKVALDKSRSRASTADGRGEARVYAWRDAADHMIAASVGEVAACAVRVPTEVIKQRAQASQHRSSIDAFRSIMTRRHTEGFLALCSELYRGWSITVFREVPFTVIQFPLWEGLKAWRCRARHTQTATGFESALFGCLSGAVAAAVTTPLDVLKTRMMLSTEKQTLAKLTQRIMREQGTRAFFAGLGPRVLWISIGGAVFLGSYQWASNNLLGIV